MRANSYTIYMKVKEPGGTPTLLVYIIMFSNPANNT